MASYLNPESAPKPDNFEALAAAWNDPMQWAVEVAKYNAQIADSGEVLTPASSHMTRAHAEHLQNHLLHGRVDYRDASYR